MHHQRAACSFRLAVTAAQTLPEKGILEGSEERGEDTHALATAGVSTVTPTGPGRPDQGGAGCSADA